MYYLDRWLPGQIQEAISNSHSVATVLYSVTHKLITLHSKDQMAGFQVVSGFWFKYCVYMHNYDYKQALAKAYGMTQCTIFRKLATVILYFHYLSLPVIITGKSEHRDVWYYSMERASIISISYCITSVQARVSPRQVHRSQVKVYPGTRESGFHFCFHHICTHTLMDITPFKISSKTHDKV